MEVMECILGRRSLRKYLDKEVSEEVVQKLINCARHAPSSKNQQPWDFIVIRNEGIIEEISSIPTEYGDYGHLRNAPVLFVCCARQIKMRELKYDHLFSVCAAVENLLLCAHSLGLGACWTFCKSDNSIPERKIKKILGIPKDTDILCLVPLGYPDPSEKIAEKKLKEPSEISHFDKW